jgi:sigma-E factor negative regulatory protein RseA
MMEQQMSREQAVDPTAAERLSALMDGELHDPAEVAQGCRAWRDDAALRQSWHRYHLIGDIMRSEDLAATGARDAAFLHGLRARLEAEPVVLAPSPISREAAVRTRRWRWAGPAAVAAGFVAVAGVLVVTRAPAPEVVEQARAPAAAPQAVVVPVAAAPQPEPAVTPVNGQLIRDARLDRYLAAHQQFAGSTALGPSTFLRRATTDAANR